jgi:hypothetical protein
MLDRLYDAADGQRDGTASIFDTAAAACHSIPPAEVLRTLGELEASGACAAAGVSLDGVGLTAVPALACEDALGVDKCTQSLGIFTCEADFGPGGMMAGKCDATCGLCGSGNGHRRLADTVQQWQQGVPFDGDRSVGQRERRLQDMVTGIGAGHICSPDKFAADAAAVTDACCDVGGDDCATGMATVCDARCALVYVGFYERCSTLLAGYEPAQSAAYAGLYKTCRDGLPLAPLLAAAGRCQ